MNQTDRVLRAAIAGLVALGVSAASGQALAWEAEYMDAAPPRSADG